MEGDARPTRATVTLRRGTMRVASGYVAACPTGGPDCGGRLTLKLRRRAPFTGKVTVVSLTRKAAVRRSRREPSGGSRSPQRASGARRLRRLEAFKATLRGALRSGSADAVVHRAMLRLTAPPRR